MYPYHTTHSRTRKTVIATVTAAIIFAGSAIGAFADGGEFEDTGYESSGEYGYGTEPTFAYSSYTSEYEGELYQYVSDDAGKGYYNVYDGSEWSGWTGWETQPADFAYDPAPVTWGGDTFLYQTGKDGKLYEYSWNSESWKAIEGDYTFKSAPATVTWEGGYAIYATAEDGYTWGNAYDGTAWGGWYAVNDVDSYAKAETDVYAVYWDDHQNVFWTGADGKAYWNRYDGTEWKGAKALPGDYTLTYGVTAAPQDGKLFAYGVSEKGKPLSTSFDGEGWSGWTEFDVSWEAKYQPTAYVYEDVQHVTYTGADGHAYHNTYAEGSWGTWEDLGSNYAWDSHQYEYDGDFYITYTGEDGKVYTKGWVPEEKSGY